MLLGDDFDASTITAVFNSGSTISSVNVPVLIDRIVEGPETFNLALMSNIARITTGPRATATGVITDSTGQLFTIRVMLKTHSVV